MVLGELGAIFRAKHEWARPLTITSDTRKEKMSLVIFICIFFGA